jgi:hypothetical protein
VTWRDKDVIDRAFSFQTAKQKMTDKTDLNEKKSAMK